MTAEEREAFIESIGVKTKTYRKKWETAKYRDFEVFNRNSVKANKRQFSEYMEGFVFNTRILGLLLTEEIIDGEFGLSEQVMAKGQIAIDTAKKCADEYESIDNNEELFKHLKRIKEARDGLAELLQEFVRAY